MPSLRQRMEGLGWRLVVDDELNAMWMKGRLRPDGMHDIVAYQGESTWHADLEKCRADALALTPEEGGNRE